MMKRRSLQTKFSFFIILSLIVAVAPIIYLSYRSLVSTVIERERANFVNTVMLLEDSLSSAYLNLLTSEVRSVRDSNQNLKYLGIFIQDQLLNMPRNRWLDAVMRWQQSFIRNGIDIALFSHQMIPLVSDFYLAQSVAEDFHDFRGESFHKIFSRISEKPDGEITVADIGVDERGTREPFVINFVPVRLEGVVLLSRSISGAVENKKNLGSMLLKIAKTKIASLQPSQDSALAIFDSSGDVLASRGNKFSLRDIPGDSLRRSRIGTPQEGVVDNDNVNFMYRIAYLKVMDWYVAAYYPMSKIAEPAYALAGRQGMIGAVLLALSVLFIIAAVMRITRPMRLLSDKARAIASADFSRSSTDVAAMISKDLPVDRNDEIGELSAAFSHMAVELEDNIHKLTENVSARQRMQGELNAAKEIQVGILPRPDSGPSVPHYRVAAFLEPAREVGGDLYDFFEMPDGRQAVVIGDVSDKGVPAALFMSMTVTLARYALGQGLSPEEAMKRINNLLEKNNPSTMFVTLFLGAFDPETGRLDFANGAHCHPIIVPSDPARKVRTLDCMSGPLVGALPDMDYTGCSETLEPGEYCFLYTDGISEAMNSAKELFGEERIIRCLDGMRGLPPRDVMLRVMEAVREYRGEEPQSDDITMLCFTRTPE